MIYYYTNSIIPYIYQISRIRTCIIARPESVPHHSAIICAVPLLLYCSLYTYPLGYRDPSVLALPYYSYTPHYTLLIIRYMYIFFHLTLPSLLLFLFLLLFIFLFYLSFYYSISTAILFYPYFSYFYFILIFLFSIIPITLYFYLYYSLDPR